jgi:hypothetical protein
MYREPTTIPRADVPRLWGVRQLGRTVRIGTPEQALRGIFRLPRPPKKAKKKKKKKDEDEDFLDILFGRR